ncbi:MAG TPA: hypothetical protein VFH73_12030 [Polyangia bacterium]|nr:hypothetical protein [Polyangia bacterium]
MVTAISCGRSDLFSGRRNGGPDGGFTGTGGGFGGGGGGFGGSGGNGVDGGRDMGGTGARDANPSDGNRDGNPIDGNPIDRGGCPVTAREICNNGIDDNCNGRIDCADPACFGDRACIVVGQEICNNGIDDDDDRLVDCADPDCVSSTACRPNMGKEICDNGVDDNGDRLVDCSDPQCVAFAGCLTVACKGDVDFGALASRDARVTKTMDTRAGRKGFATCATPGGSGRVGSFTLAAPADVRLDFSQPTGAAHVVSLFRAGVGQACDQNLVTCVRAGQAPDTSQTFAALPAGAYWLVVQSFPNTEASTTVTLSTATTATPEICNNGKDDDGNGLTDCQDLACRAAAECAPTVCNPDVNVGALIVDGPAKSASVDTSNGGDRFHPTCAGTSKAGDRTVSFTLGEAGGVLVEYVQRGQHAFGLFELPPPGLACDANQLDCILENRTNSSFAVTNVPAGRYLFIIKAASAASAGRVDLRISAFKNRKVEICGNGFDDDGNGLTDCDDPSCFGVGDCTASSCMPDVDLGTLARGAQKSVTLDVRTGRNLYQTSCGRGNGREKVVRVTLAEPMGLGVTCTQNGSHVFQLSQQVAPLDACNLHQVSCADPDIIPFGCSYIVPGLQPGQYNLLVEGFQSGSEGTVALTLIGEREVVREICDNGIDDDRDGAIDCADRKCVTSPLCAKFACRPDRSLGVLALDGNPNAVALQTSMAGDDQHATCAAAAGGQDAVVDFQLPARADLTLEWAQVGSHVLALYSSDGVLLACDAGPLVTCLNAALQPTGKQTLSSVPAGRYHLVVDADHVGGEGGVVVQLSGVIAP